MSFFYIVLLIVILERVIELQIANRNEQWMKSKGAIEVGKDHYKYFIMLHLLFFLSLIVEVQVNPVRINLFFFTIFVIAQIGRVWCITSLGRFWNTKVIVLRNVLLIKKGPYRYMKHPNYVIVFVELFVTPLIFGAYITAVLFPILHLFLLTKRIPIEEKALGKRV